MNGPVSDEEIYEYVNNKQTLFIDNFTRFPINNLTVEDKAEIWKNMGMLWELYIRNAFLGCISQKKLDAIGKAAQTYKINIFACKQNCINNIKGKKVFDELGLQEYIKVAVPLILQQKTREEERSELFIKSQAFYDSFEQENDGSPLKK